jgi:hypothetical protein
LEERAALSVFCGHCGVDGEFDASVRCAREYRGVVNAFLEERAVWLSIGDVAVQASCSIFSFEDLHTVGEAGGGRFPNEFQGNLRGKRNYEHVDSWMMRGTTFDVGRQEGIPRGFLETCICYRVAWIFGNSGNMAAGFYISFVLGFQQGLGLLMTS